MRPCCIPFRVLPWSQPNLARRSGAPGDVRYLRTVYREYEISALVELEQKLFVLFLSWDLEYTGLMNELWAGALRSMGDLSESREK